ncbi:hypothetical protein JKF63_01592 [Porcisia hertigi]|uniref:ENTH domain-containing protein n=1 Tax=Porcisia hertigi TaxID=2761500 RepID=A0A836KZL1_9TRYP|nr:hypothetical protein JKF63_01592 [Porcisia hertigi]
MNNTDTKQSAGYFKEKLTIGLSTLSGDEIVKAVMKVTSHLLKAPKEKYIQKLVAASYGQYGSGMKEGLSINAFVVRELEKRSHSHNWIVVLKTMVSFHRLMCEASDEMVETICCFRNIFMSTHIKNLADSTDGAGQAYFISQYVTYLGERCSIQSALGKGRRIDIPAFEEYLSTLNAKSLQPVFENLLALLEAVSAVEYREAVVNNFGTMEAYQLLVRDGKQVFQHLARCVIFVLDGFGEFSLPEKLRWFELYRRYTRAFVFIKSFFDSILRSSRVFVEPVPDLKCLPGSLLTRLENDIHMSKMPKEESCTLDSLGICTSEDARAETEEKIPHPPEPEPDVANPSESVTSRPLAGVAFSMDDLFVSNQEPLKPGRSSLSPTSWTPSPQPAVSCQCGAEPLQWDTGAPSNWSSGVPQNWGSGAPATFEANTSLSPAQQQCTFLGSARAFPEGGPYSIGELEQGQAPLPAQTKASTDPFKELYERSHLDFA